MHLDFPTTTLLAGLPYLLSPPPVGKIAVRDDIVGSSVSVALIQQTTFGVFHMSFVTHSGRRKCMSNNTHHRRDGLCCESTRWWKLLRLCLGAAT
jgi:hypothetical protein